MVSVPKLIERKLDDDCGCPEELWEAFGAHLHMHLSASTPSNAHADYGDHGEATMEVTAATHDLARAAIFGWARELQRPTATSGADQPAAGPVEFGEADDRGFWLIVREPGKAPDLRGPWPHADLAMQMRAEIKQRPTAYIDVLTIDYLGPEVQHGPEALQMADGRSVGTGRAHNARVRAAHTASLAADADLDRRLHEFARKGARA